MKISPDDYIFDADGIYQWTPQRANEAWKKAEKDFKDQVNSGSFTKVALLCGIPGAGKSTYIANHGKPDWLYFDATLVSPKARKKVLGWIKGSPIKKIAIHLDTPLALCLERNSARTSDRSVPYGTMKSMSQNITAPTKGEGFDEIITVTWEDGKIGDKKILGTTPLKGRYAAIVLTKESKAELLEAFPPIHAQTFGHHVTLWYAPTEAQIEEWKPMIGEIVTVTVGDLFQDHQGQCLTVSVPTKFQLNPAQKHHLTISTAPQVAPAYSSKLLEKTELMIRSDLSISEAQEFAHGKSLIDKFEIV